MCKYFIITVDTEGDNGWTYRKGDRVHTECVLYIPRFQELCDKYSFKPVYLTNYEMAADPRFANYIKGVTEKGQCEVGIHVHAWNNPPIYELPKYECDQSYLYEYPYEIMKAKFAETYNLIKTNIGVTPVSHRAGRWAMDKQYFRLLEEFKVLVDCSYTPHVDWSATKGATKGGADYTCAKENSHKKGNVLEVPATVFDTGERIHMGKRAKIQQWLHFKKIPHKIIWLRPAASELQEMKQVIDYVMCQKNLDFAEFMIHSSELMPGGSPYFEDEASIEKLYATMDELFQYAKEKGFVGCTLKEYYEQKN